MSLGRPHRVVIDQNRASHIFRHAEGHFHEDTLANRQALVEAASQFENFMGSDRFGNSWFAELRADGSQVWVQVRDNKITNGGVNVTPRNFHFAVE